MESKIEAFGFFSFVDPETDGELDEEQGHEADDRRPDDRQADAFDLDPDLMRVAIDPAGFSFAADSLNGEDAGEHSAEDAADAVDAEDVERIVIAESMLQAGDAPVADDARRKTDNQCAIDADETASRRDRDEAGNRAGDSTEKARLAFDDPLDERPRDCISTLTKPEAMAVGG
jgi:hypothetical protein